MSEKAGGRKLGRNPFEHKKPSQHKRHERKDPPLPQAVSAESAMDRRSDSQNPQIEIETSGREPQANPAWILVDLWAGLFTEPYFFWKQIGDSTLFRKY